MNLPPLLPLPEDWEPTRATLHHYARAIGVIARAHGVADPRWWHVSLRVRPTHLATGAMPLPRGGTFALRMDLRTATTVWETNGEDALTVPMDAGMTGTEFGDRLISIARGYGLEGDYERSRFESNEHREYDAEAAGGFFAALVNVATNIETFRESLEGETSPVQLWPHGFDLSSEWFGTRLVEYDGQMLPAQLNLGFYPAGRAYFYSNPWPFSEGLLDAALPEPAAWKTDDWSGSILYYDELLAVDSPEHTLAEYARAVHDAARPTLT